MFAGANNIFLERVRVQGTGLDLRLTQRRTTNLLNTADLLPRAMPLAAVLVVKQLSALTLGELADEWDALKVRRDWERRVRDRLTDMYRHAVKPARQPVADNAQAVIFADESELLACLLRDLSQNEVFHRWWWQSLLVSGMLGPKPHSHSEIVEVVVRQMIEKPHIVPGIITYVEAWGQATRAMGLFSKAQVEEVLQAVLQAYKLPSISREWVAAPPSPPPWKSGRVIRKLDKEHNALLGLSLDLQIQPQKVRSPGYQQQFHLWWRTTDSTRAPEYERNLPKGALSIPSISGNGQQSSSVNVNAIPREPFVPKPTPVSPADHQSPDLFPQKDANPFGTPAKEIESLASPEEQNGNRYTPAANIAHEAQNVEVYFSNNGSGRTSRNFTSREHTARSAQIEPQHESMEPTALLSPAPELETEGSPEELQIGAELPTWLSNGVPTRLGGVLYLINLMLYLDLPGCFEEGWYLSSRLGAWGMLEVLARGMLGEAIQEFEDDPLWAALAYLDGRNPDQPPGYLLPQPRPRRWPKLSIPEAWRSGLPPDANQPNRSKRRRKLDWLQLESAWLQRWLDVALPFIEYRLRLALNLSPEASLTEPLLMMPAHLYISSSHVDLATSLEQISLPVRLAGLDRNPGWLPEFGRVVYFHFQE